MFIIGLESILKLVWNGCKYFILLRFAFGMYGCNASYGSEEDIILQWYNDLSIEHAMKMILWTWGSVMGFEILFVSIVYDTLSLSHGVSSPDVLYLFQL